MVTNGFPRSARLLSSGEFRHVFDTVSCKASNAHFVLLANTNLNGSPRIGFVIGKKNIRKAVHRNRIRRVIRESFRLNRAKIPALDIIVLVRKGADQFDNQHIANQLDYLWRKLRQRAEKFAEAQPSAISPAKETGLQQHHEDS